MDYGPESYSLRYRHPIYQGFEFLPTSLTRQPFKNGIGIHSPLLAEIGLSLEGDTGRKREDAVALLDADDGGSAHALSSFKCTPGIRQAGI